MTTIIVRHRRENRKKCTLTALENHPNFTFLSYPLKPMRVQNAILLSLEGKELTRADQNKPLIILDGLWRYIPKMEKIVFSIEKRTLPKGFQTAYPRRQNDCIDPLRGLASIEALYVAYTILGKDRQGLLDHYHFKKAFLELNQDLLDFFEKDQK